MYSAFIDRVIYLQKNETDNAEAITKVNQKILKLHWQFYTKTPKT